MVTSLSTHYLSAEYDSDEPEYGYQIGLRNILCDSRLRQVFDAVTHDMSKWAKHLDEAGYIKADSAEECQTMMCLLDDDIYYAMRKAEEYDEDLSNYAAAGNF